MRKVIWCCSAAGILAAGSFLSLAYYACRCPGSVVGRSMQMIAEASIAMQPLSGLTSMAVRTNQPNETAALPDECVPDDPQPVAHERKEDEFGTRMHEVEPDAAPIVIHEDDPMPREGAVPASPAPIAGEAEFKDIEIDVNEANTGSLISGVGVNSNTGLVGSIVLNERNFETADMQGHEVPPKGFPTVMPYCRDDEEEPVTPPKMPRAEGSEEAEPSVFKAWIELFAEGSKEKAPEVEELPPPQEEEPQDEPKCEEDRHLHEHYPGCPRTTCPYTDRNHIEQYHKNHIEQYHKRPWDLDPNFDSWMKKKGSEESSEEPPHSGKKRHHDKEECPRTKGVDTMEYRKSDAGLDEYGPGQVH